MSLGFGQLLFKLAADDIRAKFAVSWISAALSPWLIGALLLYALTTALWIWILSQSSLSRAYPFALLGAALVPVLATVVLKEPLGLPYLAGMAMVVAGLAIIQLS